MKSTAVFLAGLNNSGPGHWQRAWHEALPGSVWVEHADWDWPSSKTWLADLERDLKGIQGPLVAVGHSLGCLLLGQWAAAHPQAPGFRAALLVAPPDAESPFLDGLGFAPGWSTGPLGFPALVLASGDDPYSSLAHARRCAEGWQAGFLDVGRLGHINADSKLGDWPEGRRLFDEFLAEQKLEL